MTQPPDAGSKSATIYDRSVPSLVLGILSVVLPPVSPVTGIIAIVFATKTLRAYRNARNSGATTILSRTKGSPVTRQFAVAGLVTGIVSMFWATRVVLFMALHLFAATSAAIVVIGAS